MLRLIDGIVVVFAIYGLVVIYLELKEFKKGVRNGYSKKTSKKENRQKSKSKKSF